MSLKDKAKKTLLARGKYLIERNNKLFKYKSETSNRNYEILVNENDISCNCLNYLNRAICKHVVMVSLTKKIEIPGIVFQAKFQRRTIQRGPKKRKATKALKFN